MWQIKRWCVMTIIHYCLIFWHQNAATSWGPLTHLSMKVALVFGRCMLTYGTWQWGHTGAAGRMALMMITKKRDDAAKWSTVCQDLSHCKRQEWYKSYYQKHFSFTKYCWLSTKSLTDALKWAFSQRAGNSLYADYGLLSFSFLTLFHYIVDWACWQKCQHFFSSLKFESENSDILFCHHHFVTFCEM